jgi:hypothetical protein
MTPCAMRAAVEAEKDPLKLVQPLMIGTSKQMTTRYGHLLSS